MFAHPPVGSRPLGSAPLSCFDHHASTFSVTSTQKSLQVLRTSLTGKSFKSAFRIFSASCLFCSLATLRIFSAAFLVDVSECETLSLLNFSPTFLLKLFTAALAVKFWRRGSRHSSMSMASAALERFLKSLSISSGRFSVIELKAVLTSSMSRSASSASVTFALSTNMDCRMRNRGEKESSSYCEDISRIGSMSRFAANCALKRLIIESSTLGVIGVFSGAAAAFPFFGGMFALFFRCAETKACVSASCFCAAAAACCCCSFSLKGVDE
mmetsp:Transcript_11847/g.26577  ORF Transcript_11847/g.26577 Transcript_11847/m.26577 type:complete len:269 (+) Transcript_11847:673-1479(+)